MTQIDVLTKIKEGANPQQIVMDFLEGEISNTPFGANLLSLAKQGKGAEIEKIARNLTASQGRDFDSEFKAFRQHYGL